MGPDGSIDESKRATLRRFAALGATSPFVGFAGSEGESDARDAIAGYLSATPGAHFSKVRDDLQLGTGETQHHLRELTGRDVLESTRDGDYRRFFPAGQFSPFEKVVLGYLRRPTVRGMLVALLRDPTRSAGGLADLLGVSGATVSAYAADLEAAGILSREGGYTIEEPEVVLTLVVRYADSFDEDALELAAVASDLVSYDP